MSSSLSAHESASTHSGSKANNNYLWLDYDLGKVQNRIWSLIETTAKLLWDAERHVIYLSSIYFKRIPSSMRNNDSFIYSAYRYGKKIASSYHVKDTWS